MQQTQQRERERETSEFQTSGETATTTDLQKPKRENMTIDVYIDYINSNHQSILYAYQLRKIIAMHGFKSIQPFDPKEELVEAVKCIELMEPARSTLKNDHVTSGSSITLQEAMRDLSSLKWQECCITSLQTINAVNNHQLVLSTADTTTTTTTVASVCSKKSNSKSDLSSGSKKKKLS